MNDTRNKFLALTITIVIMLVLVTGGYFLFYRDADTEQQVGQGSRELKKVSDDAVISPVASYDNNSVWYFNSAGQLFERSLDGSQLDEYTLPDLEGTLQSVLWPASGDDFLAIMTTGQKILYEDAKKQYRTLPINIKSIDWFPDGKRVAYVWQSGDNKSQQLIVANSDTSGFRVVSNIFWPDMAVKISPDGKKALLYRTQIQETNKIYLVDLNTGEFKTVIEDGKNMEAKWVTADKFVYVSDSGSNDLMLYDLNQKLQVDLNLLGTADRLTVDRLGNMYVSPEGQGKQSIWKVNTNSLQQEKIYEFTESVVPRNLFMISQMIGFVNGNDKKLYIVQ